VDACGAVESSDNVMQKDRRARYEIDVSFNFQALGDGRGAEPNSLFCTDATSPPFASDSSVFVMSLEFIEHIG